MHFNLLLRFAVLESCCDYRLIGGNRPSFDWTSVHAPEAIHGKHVPWHRSSSLDQIRVHRARREPQKDKEEAGEEKRTDEDNEQEEKGEGEKEEGEGEEEGEEEDENVEKYPDVQRREEEAAHAEIKYGFLTGMTLLSFLVFIMYLLYMTQNKDPQLSAYSYKTLSLAIGIFLALMGESAQDAMLVHYVTHAFTGKGLSETNVDEIILTVLFVVWYILMTFFAYKNKDSHENLAVVQVFVMHLAVFVAINLFGNLQNKIAMKQQAFGLRVGAYAGFAIAMVIVLKIFSKIMEKVRDKLLGNAAHGEHEHGEEGHSDEDGEGGSEGSSDESGDKDSDDSSDKDSKAKAKAKGDGHAEGEGEAKAEAKGDEPADGEEAAKAEAKGDEPADGEGAAKAEAKDDGQAEGDGAAKASDGHGESDGAAKAEASGDGEGGEQSPEHGDGHGEEHGGEHGEGEHGEGEHGEGHGDEHGHGHGHHPPHWVHIAIECEDEFSGLLFGFLMGRAIAFACTDTFQTEAFENGWATSAPGSMMKLAIAFVVTFIMFICSTRLIDTMDHMLAEYIEIHFEFLCTWTALNLIRLIILKPMYAQDEENAMPEYQKAETNQRAFIAFSTAPLIIFGLAAVDALGDRGLIRDFTANEVIESIGLLTGLLWEGAFHASLHGSVHKLHLGHEGILAQGAITLAIVATILPAWKWYIIPVALKPVQARGTEKEIKEGEEAAQAEAAEGEGADEGAESAASPESAESEAGGGEKEGSGSDGDKSDHK